MPLAILAGCQTLTMLTGGIDLSVGAVASMAGFVMATLVHQPGAAGRRSSSRSSRPALAGLITGIGVGVFRVHPLIMTLGMSLVVLGLANVWQLADGPDAAPASRDDLRRLGSGTLARRPARTACSSSCRWRLLILLGLRRTGYGRLLFAIGDNPVAARLSGARAWQVLIVLYVISALLAASPACSSSGLTNTASVSLADPSCCRRSPPRSSAGRRSSAAAAATAGRSSAR